MLCTIGSNVLVQGPGGVLMRITKSITGYNCCYFKDRPQRKHQKNKGFLSKKNTRFCPSAQSNCKILTCKCWPLPL